jgi:hypothetical protein
MGMDVYGRKPKNETGEYFRRNVWGWHPLWEYCCEANPEITSKVENGHSNDGDGLNGSDTFKLAKSLKANLASGAAAQYIKERQEFLNSLPLENCKHCETTGKRTWKAGEGPNDTQTTQVRTCNGCNGEGKVKSFATNYHLDLEDIQEFHDFLMSSGGFSIC